MPDMKFPFRSLLMLQGPVGPFFRKLARTLRQQGVDVHKINLNAGDALFYPGPDAVSYKGSLQDWPEYLRGLMVELGVDAIALFGDCRSYHKPAIALARSEGIPVFVFEEGYVRPDYITVEIDGVNGNSRLMSLEAVPGAQEPPDRTRSPIGVGNTFPALAFWSALYSIAKDICQPFFRHYSYHRPNTLSEALSYSRSMIRKLLHGQRDRKALAAIERKGAQFFLFPLQVYHDSQIRHHSPFVSVADLVRPVIESFAKSAPEDSYLLIKHHPMDRGHSCYGDLIAKEVAKLGCSERVIYFSEGHLPTLLGKASGTVTCNSTVGLSSLIHQTPVKVLGYAIYDRPHLTAQCSLDEFWSEPPPVDKKMVTRFLAFLTATCQVNGSFYTGDRRVGVLESVAAKMAQQYRLEAKWRRGSRRASTAEVQTELGEIQLFSQGR